MALSLSPVERHEKPLVVSGRPNGKSFMAKWQTYLAKHTTGRAMAGMLAVFAEFERGILRERVKAGIAEARRRGTRHGRPPTVAQQGEAVRQLAADGLSKSAIARQLGIGRTSVRRLLDAAAVRRSSGPG